jgi:hypothetical protein
MSCLECHKAGDCHTERRKVIKQLTDAIEHLSKGYLALAFEDLELLLVRLENEDRRKTER